LNFSFPKEFKSDYCHAGSIFVGDAVTAEAEQSTGAIRFVRVDRLVLLQGFVGYRQ
jgi:hypothetical protein